MGKAMMRGGSVRRVVAGVGLALLGLTMSGVVCAQTAAAGYQAAEWTKIVADARKEGRVTLYTAAPPQVTARVSEGFKAAYPDIILEAISAASAQLLPRIQRERSSGVDGADVYVTTDLVWVLDSGKDGKLLKPAGPALTAWPARYVQNNMVTVAIGVNPIIYNKALVPNPPKGYADLLRPEFRGKLGTIENPGSYIVAWYDWLEKAHGADFLDKLRAQNPKLYTTAVPMTQAVASGEITVAAFGNTPTFSTLIAAGAPLVILMPNPALGFQYGMAGLASSKRPNAALVLVDYLMSRPGQSLWHMNKDTSSPLPNIPGAMDIPNVVFWNPGDYPPEVTRKYMERWNRIFK